MDAGWVPIAMTAVRSGDRGSRMLARHPCRKMPPHKYAVVTCYGVPQLGDAGQTLRLWWESRQKTSLRGSGAMRACGMIGVREHRAGRTPEPCSVSGAMMPYARTACSGETFSARRHAAPFQGKHHHGRTSTST